MDVDPALPSSLARRSIAIDALRGLAAVGVVCCHSNSLAELTGLYSTATGWQASNPLTYLFNSFMQAVRFVFSFGFSGVWLFFIISGFCIHMRAARALAIGKAPDLRFFPFWKRRFRRLYPAYFIALSLYVLVKWLKGEWHPDAQSLYDVFLHLTLMHNLDPRTTYSIEVVFWTLAIEEQLYLAYFVLLWIKQRIGWAQTLAVCLAMRLAWFALGFLVHRLLGQQMVVYESAPACWFIWALGALAVEVAVGLVDRPRWLPGFRAGCGLLAFAATLTIIDRDATSVRMIHHPASLVLPLLWGTGYLGILNALIDREQRWGTHGVPWPARTLAGIGLFSYSLYLTHDLIVRDASMAVFSSIHVTEETRLFLVFVVFIPLSLLCSWLFFLAVERPFLVHRPNSQAAG